MTWAAAHTNDPQSALIRARKRVASAVPYSPEWAAAVEEVEELEQALPDAPGSDAQANVRGESRPLSSVPNAAAA